MNTSALPIRVKHMDEAVEILLKKNKLERVEALGQFIEKTGTPYRTLTLISKGLGRPLRAGELLYLQTREYTNGSKKTTSD